MAPTVLRGEGRTPGGVAAPAVVTLEADGFSVATGGAAPWAAAYRDLATVTVDAGAVLVVLGNGGNERRWLFERFGAGLGALARGFREGRLRQWLTDGLVELDAEAPIDLVEYATGAENGVAQLVYHDRGVVLAPLDERVRPIRIRRADIGAVVAHPELGGLRIEGAEGRPLASGTEPVAAVELLRLGRAGTSHEQRWTALRDGAAADSAAIVGVLLPDAPFDLRRRAASILVEGRPGDPAALGNAWGIVEGAMLSEPPFAESYRSLLERSGGATARRWLAIAPERPGASPDARRVWFFVGLPGNLVALELVSAGAHATYLFRVAPRATYAVEAAAETHLAAAVRDVSEALIDGRFLREPMALPPSRLMEPRYLRYRLALSTLPSLASARQRFVARIAHRDPASWTAALDDLIRWHGSARDESEWPGRVAQEAQIDAGEAES